MVDFLTRCKKLVVIGTVALLLAACTAALEPAGQAPTVTPAPVPTETPEPTEPPVDPIANELVDGEWVLVELDGMPVPGGLTLTFTADMVSGYDGCNSFSGSYTLVDGALVVPPESLISTLRLCVDESLAALSHQYILTLTSGAAISLENEQLTILSDQGELRLARPETRTFFVSGEQADCVGVAPQKCLLVKEAADAEYEYFYDSIIGFEWEAGYEYELLVNVSDVANPPADGSALRYQLVAIISQTSVAATAAEIGDINWSLIHYVVGGDAVVPVPDFAEPNFTISDGLVSGYSGCNSFGGEITIQGGSISFGPLVATERACEGEVMALERMVLEILNRAARFALIDGQLELYDAEGLPLGLFGPAGAETAITETVWQWLRFEDGAGLNNIEVADPAGYTLQLMADGTYFIQADCNSSTGAYTLAANSIVIEPGATTMVLCDEGSLGSEFLRMLGDAVTFVFDDDGHLVLNLVFDSGNMVFKAAG